MSMECSLALGSDVLAATKEGLQAAGSERKIHAEEWRNESNQDFVKHLQ